MNMKTLIGSILISICLVVFAMVYHNYIISNKPRKARYYCAFSPQDYDNASISHLNQTKFLKHLDIVVDLGFNGVVLHRVESFYYDGILDWVLNESKDRNLDVMFAVYYFNVSQTFPFDYSKFETWNRTGFMVNDAEFNLYVEWLQNITDTAISYPNFKGFIFFYPFNNEMRDWWKTQIQTVDYQRKMQLCLSTLKRGKPVYLTAEPWGPDVYDGLPKNFFDVDGFAIQAYNLHAIDDIEWSWVLDQKEYWSGWFDEIHIAEFGYHIVGRGTHGLASSEQSKADMVRQFIRKTWLWDSIAVYCFLEDFILEEADYGLIYDDGTYKLAAYVFKEMLRK